MAALIKSKITLVDMTDVLVQSVEPTAVPAGTRWINTGSSPYVLYTYGNDSTWVRETDYDILNAFSMHDIVLEDMTADGRLTPYEKSQLIKIISPKLADANALKTQATALGSSTVTQLSNAISALESLYNTSIAVNPDGTSDVGVAFDDEVLAAINALSTAMIVTSADVSAINRPVVLNLSKDSYLIQQLTASSTTVEITALKGTTAIPVTVAVTGQIAGQLTTSIANNNSTKVTVTINVTTAMATKIGSLLFTINADGKEYKRDFVYATALKGVTGDAGYMLSLTNESHVFAGDVTTALEGSTTSQVIAYRGSVPLSATFGEIVAPTGMTITKVNDGQANASLIFAVTSGLTPLKGDIIIPITIDGQTMSKVFSYSVSLKGESGVSGKDAIYPVVWAPQGDTFQSIGGSVPDPLPVTCDLYIGGVVQDVGVLYQWYIQNGSADEGAGAGWKELNAVTPYGTSGYTTKTLTVLAAAVPATENFKCKVIYDGVPYYGFVTLRDLSDPYQVILECLQGFTFLNGGGVEKTLTARIYQNGTEVDLSGTVFNYDWQKFSDGIQDTSFSRVTKSIKITSEDVDRSATYICNVSTKA